MNYLKLSWKRWLTWLLVATVFAIACVFLSEWQFDRRAHRVAEISLVQKNYDASAIELSDALQRQMGNSSDSALSNLKWHRVTVSGHYLVDAALLVRNRPQSGQPGFESLVPFETDSGVVIAVSRGWLPTGNLQDSPDRVPTPSAEQQTITGRLIGSESDIGRDAPAGQVANFELSAVAQATNLPVVEGWYLRMSAEQLTQVENPVQLLRPSTDEGNHLSYAIQWIIFGILAFAVLIWAIKREYEFYRSQTDVNYRPKVTKLKHADLDAQTEDQLG